MYKCLFMLHAKYSDTPNLWMNILELRRYILFLAFVFQIYQFPFYLLQSSLLAPCGTSETFCYFMPVEPQQMLMQKPLCPFQHFSATFPQLPSLCH